MSKLDLYRFSHDYDAYAFLMECKAQEMDTSRFVVIFPEYVCGEFDRWVTLDDSFVQVDLNGRVLADMGHPCVAYPLTHEHLLEFREGAVCYGDGFRVSRFHGRWIPLVGRDFFGISDDVMEVMLTEGHFDEVVRG